MLAILLVAGMTGCRKPESTTPPGAGTQMNPPGTPPAQTSVAPVRPAPWAGAGLADPCITPEGQLELIFADARGTVKVNPAGTKVSSAALSPDRQQLVYSIAAWEMSTLYDHIFVVTAAGASCQQRELKCVTDTPVYATTWSPDSRYLLIDSGTSATRGTCIIEPASDRLVAALCTTSECVWAPGEPTRLAAVLVSDRPLAPLTELEQTTDLAVIDFASGRIARLASGTMMAIWSRPTWLEDGRLQAVSVSIPDDGQGRQAFGIPSRDPGPLPAVDASPLSGAATAGELSAEVSLRGELLLVDSVGAVVRRLTERAVGVVTSPVLTSDGKYLVARLWAGEPGDPPDLLVYTLPELSARRISAGDLGGLTGGGLTAAPGGQPLVLCEDSHRNLAVFDVAAGRAIWHGRGLGATWLPDDGGAPRLVSALGMKKSDQSALSLSDMSLVTVEPRTGATTVMRESVNGVGYWPMGLADGGATIEYIRADYQHPATVLRVAVPPR